MFSGLEIIRNTKQKKVGFTLVELSIVLVIIGLIIGGVLVGRDLIVQSSIRAQMSQIESLETSIHTFKLKHNCLPGDCTSATLVFGATDPSGNTINNGNGDGIIKAAYGGNGVLYGAGECLMSDISGEVSQLFLQLNLAGFGDYTKGTLNVTEALIGRDYPYARFGNGTGVFVTCLGSVNWPISIPLFLRQGNVITIGATGATSGSGSRIFYALGMASQWGSFGLDGSNLPLIPQGISSDVFRIIDNKIDDGKPSTGKFGIIAGQAACDNVSKSYNSQPLLANYLSPSVSCNATAGKKID